MLHNCQPVPIHSLVFTDEWNLHPWECRDIFPDLDRSFALVGILHPPIVQAHKTAGTYSIVHGFKRLSWAKRQDDIETVTCIILPHDLNSKIIFDVLLTDHLIGPAISLAEKARFLVLASRFMDKKHIQSDLFSLLHLKKNTSLSDFSKILDQNEVIIKDIHQGRLQEKMISEILKLQREDERLALVNLFRYLGLGDGKQKRLFTLIRDIAFRKNLSILDFLNKDEIQSVVNHPEMNPPQKAQYLANLLQGQLTPEYNSYTEQFERQKNQLQLPSNCSIDHVPAFEKDEVTLSITFKNFDDCKAHLPRIIKESIASS